MQDMERMKDCPVLLLREDQEITTISSLFASSLSPSASSSSLSASRCTVAASPISHHAVRYSSSSSSAPAVSSLASKSKTHGRECKWSSQYPLLISIAMLLLSDSFVVVVSGKNFKCDFQKYPDSGCQDAITTTCNSETDQCICRPQYPVNVNGRCFAYRDISDLCVTSRQCSKIKAKCIDNAGDEVVVNEENSSTSGTSSTSSSPAPAAVSKPHESSLRMMVGICKCPEGLFHHPETNECHVRILGRKCYFNTDCKCVSPTSTRVHNALLLSPCVILAAPLLHPLLLFIEPVLRSSLTDPRILIVFSICHSLAPRNDCKHLLIQQHTTGFQRSHSFCDGSRCKCKSGFMQDYATDECRPSLVSLCMYGYVYENGTQKCRPSTKSDTGAFDPHSGARPGHPSPLSSSLSALFWPVIAFFLVILLLKMLKEGMRRDCERAAASVAAGGGGPSSSDPRNRHRRPRSHHHHHRSLGHHSRPFRHYPSDLMPSIGQVPNTVSSSSRNRAPEIIVLMPPPPYSPSATGPEVSLASAVVEEPPTYEEATRK